jgi:hypothetical protein
MVVHLRFEDKKAASLSTDGPLKELTRLIWFWLRQSQAKSVHKKTASISLAVVCFRLRA